ncbi:probable xyloglucan endotransglucosylase/hydrolase protein 33 [Chenopodium quinoa]|uniref:Xyloglucan endotransglucosylase/hydrolase n=1 Tax=Chenopodium quinoa TaxID=63459 RepID=A0A803LJ72_CHEQI|nr:probable xyloglucan endotransglucosylase/hydrolase protein 33 [Chenopodium quinoa]
MAYLLSKNLHLQAIILSTFILLLSSSNHGTNAQSVPPSSTRLTSLFPHLSFDRDYSQMFGDSNAQIYGNGSFAKISLDKKTGAGFGSKNHYNYGFFSAAIKLPPGFTSGVVVAFYMSNSDIFPHNHDEIDFELLGHQKSRNWVLQTNMYGNGSVKTGREEKFRLWFDPTTQFHEYSIIWNSHHIVFLVDNIPIREVQKTPTTSSSYPSKPMAVYATIWDASPWATHGGKYPVNYKYAPFTASLGEMEMAGCIYDPKDLSGKSCSKSSSPSSLDPLEGQDFVKLSNQQNKGLQWARSKQMIYSYCKDKRRYKVLPPECTTK